MDSGLACFVFEHLSFPPLGKLLLRRGGLMMGAEGQGEVPQAYYRLVQDKVFQHIHRGQMLKHQSLETWLIYWVSSSILPVPGQINVLQLQTPAGDTGRMSADSPGQSYPIRVLDQPLHNRTCKGLEVTTKIWGPLRSACVRSFIHPFIHRLLVNPDVNWEWSSECT